MGWRDTVQTTLANGWRAFTASETVTFGAPETAVREAIFTGPGIFDIDANLGPSQGGSLFFRRLTQSQRDLTMLTRERALEIAFWLWMTNPLAKRILELTRDFVLGGGLIVTVQEDRATGETDRLADDDAPTGGPLAPTAAAQQQAVIDRFWHDPINALDLKLYEMVLELGLFGEQIYPISVNPTSGAVRLGLIDPLRVKSVIVDGRNPKIPRAIELSEGTQSSDQRFKVIALQDDMSQPWYGRMVGVATDPSGTVIETWRRTDANGRPEGPEYTYLGACFLWQINKVANASRGYSDLLPLADWIDALDQILFGEVDRNLLLRSFIWDVKMTGAAPRDIEDYRNSNPPPKPGSVRIHNEKIEWTAVSPNLQSADVQTAVDTVLSYIATGAGIPKTWLNGTMDVNRATAAELNDPGLKRLAMRQRYVKNCVAQIVTFVLDQAEIRGVLPMRPNLPGSPLPVPWTFTIHTPEITEEDKAQAASSMSQAFTAASLAVADGAMDIQTYQEIVARMTAAIGVEVDLDAMRDRIAAANDADAGPGIGIESPPTREQLRQALAADAAGPDGERVATANGTAPHG